MTSKLKTAISLFTVLFFTILFIGSSKSKETSFDNYKDAIRYVKYESYLDLVELWGEPSSIGKPYLSSDNSRYEVIVIWNNVFVEGKRMEIRFTNSVSAPIRNNGTVQSWPVSPIEIQVGSVGYGW